MRHKLQTEVGRAVYKMRKAIVEPAFGQIKEQRGFRRFSLRGKQNVRCEWRLVCAASYLLKLFRAGWALETASTARKGPILSERRGRLAIGHQPEYCPRPQYENHSATSPDQPWQKRYARQTPRADQMF